MSGNPRGKQYVNVKVPLSVDMRDGLFARSKRDGTAPRSSVTEGVEMSIQNVLSSNRAFNLQRRPRNAFSTTLSIEKSLAARLKDLAVKLDTDLGDVVYSMLVEEAALPPRTVSLDGFLTAHAA